MVVGITCYPVYGGSGVVATELGLALAARGHEVHFISYALPFRLEHIKENVFFHEVTVNGYPLFEYPPYTLNLASKMVDVALSAKLDLLHVHYAIPHTTSALFARQILREKGINLPVVTTLHGTDITIVGRDPSFKHVVNHSINHANGVTAVSDYLRRETLLDSEITKEIEVIPNFIDTERFRPMDKRHFKAALCPEGQPLLMHVSNFRPVKRAPDVIRIFRELLDRSMEAKLLMVGDGPDRAVAERLARELGVYENIRFLGKQDPIEEILSLADVFIMPSASETFGLAALEAMACGVPTIVNQVGGLPELVTHSVDGFLCGSGTIGEYVDYAYQILTKPELAASLSEAGRKRAKDFELRAIIPQYESFYARTIEQTMLPD